jgi:hypothetical protein
MNTVVRRASYLAPWLLILFFIVMAALPERLWFEVNSVRVSDAKSGVPPALSVDRIIRRSFDGEWTATVSKAQGERFVVVCAASGRNEYRRDAALPADLNLHWWTWPVKCDLRPGEYILTTRWRIMLPIPWPKSVTVTSNVFRVTTH